MVIEPGIARMIDEIRTDRSRGAIELARQAVVALKTVTQGSRARGADELLQEQIEVGRALRLGRLTPRPDMGTIICGDAPAGPCSDLPCH